MSPVTPGALRPDLTLVLLPACPWCGRLMFSIDADDFSGVLSCAKCDRHWWAMRLEGGDVRTQLLDHFEGDAGLVDQIITSFMLPPTLPSPGAFWQIKLEGRQSHRYHKHPERSGRVRSVALLRGLVALFRHAS
jgi:hypothetical protein